MKSRLTPSPSNQLSHDSPAGVSMRARPTATTSTRFTLSGNATDFGRRTAWLRLLLKTAPCSTIASSVDAPVQRRYGVHLHTRECSAPHGRLVAGASPVGSHSRTTVECAKPCAAYLPPDFTEHPNAESGVFKQRSHRIENIGHVLLGKATHASHILRQFSPLIGPVI